MTTKKFIAKTVIKLVILLLLFALFESIVNLPILDNQLALTQFEQDNIYYMTMNAFYSIRPVINVILGFIQAGIIAWIGLDIYKFIKEKNKNEEV